MDWTKTNSLQLRMCKLSRNLIKKTWRLRRKSIQPANFGLFKVVFGETLIAAKL